MRVSLSEIWGTAFIFLRQNAGLLLPLALALLAIGRFGFDRAIFGVTKDGGDVLVVAIMAVSMVMVVTSLAAVRAIVLIPDISVGEAIALGFRRSPRLLTVAGALALLQLAATLPVMRAVQAGGAEQMEPVMLMTCLGGILLYYYFSARLLCFSPIIIDQDLPLGEALTLSWKQTAGNHFGLFGMLILVQMAGDLLGISVGAVLLGLLTPLESFMAEPGLANMLALFGATMMMSLVSTALAVFSALFYRRVSVAT